MIFFKKMEIIIFQKLFIFQNAHLKNKTLPIIYIKIQHKINLLVKINYFYFLITVTF